MSRAHRRTFSRIVRVVRATVPITAILGFASCEPSPKTAPVATASKSAPVAPSASATSSAPAGREKPVKKDRADRTHRAGRCGECHEKMYDEWTSSPHAKSDDSPVFAAMRKQGGAACHRCHAPLTLLKEPAAFAAREGVSCEVCHRIESVAVEKPFAKMELLLAHEVKLGPRCDPSEPYFHRARCSPLFTQSELCAACHQLYQPTGSDGTLLPVHTEYSDFKKSAHAARGKTCQSCHMPGVRAELAVGEPEREGVPDHGFLGKAGKLRGTALKATARASWKPGAVKLTLSLTNARAGHALPAGAPGREFVISVFARDRDGKELVKTERVFGRRLVDAAGAAVPFYLASRVEADTRIQPGETRQEHFDIEGDAIGELLVSAGFRTISPELSRNLGLPASPAPTVLWEKTIPVGPAPSGARSTVLRP